MKFGYHTVSWGYKKISRFFASTLNEISSAGFSAFETHDIDVIPFMGNPKGFVDILSETEMHLIGVYCPGQFVAKSFIDSLILKYYLNEMQRFTKFAQFVSSVGGEKLIVGGTVGLYAKNDKQFRNFCNMLNKLGTVCNDLGVKLTLHPHLGTIVENDDNIAQFCELTDPDLVNFALETAHQYLSGSNLVEVIEKYPDRINHVHFKDVASNKFVEFGTGTLDFPQIIQALKNVGYDDWIVVENELNLPDIQWSDTTDKSPLEIAKTTRAYLDKM